MLFLKLNRKKDNISYLQVLYLNILYLERVVPEISQYGPYFLPLNVFIASKGSKFYILFIFTSNVTTLVKEVWLFSVYGVYLLHPFKTVVLKSKEKRKIICLSCSSLKL